MCVCVCVLSTDRLFRCITPLIYRYMCVCVCVYIYIYIVAAIVFLGSLKHLIKFLIL